ncbi:hypothetical protein [Deinococcus apachensis]|uniref:hypothetical protein n=1 Tax=Deinococcus apachensis TaxID=309886 RepID=UPI0012FCDD4D|nr:hypothetical protein [Deinococcus apachensis]
MPGRSGLEQVDPLARERGRLLSAAELLPRRREERALPIRRGRGDLGWSRTLGVVKWIGPPPQVPGAAVLAAQVGEQGRDLAGQAEQPLLVAA